MLAILTDPTFRALAALFVVAAMFVLFVRETYPTEVVAISGAAVLVATGLLPYESAVAVFANPAPWTIGAMFVVMGALVRTGALGWFTALSETRAVERPFLVMSLLTLFGVVSSAVVSNTPVVVVMIPVTIQFSRSLGIAASNLRIPRCYVALPGG